MRAGTLRHFITITRPLDSGETTQNSYGEDVTTPEEEIGTFSCQVECMVGRELQNAMQRWAEAKYKITMRPQPGITFTRKMRVAWKSQTLDILDIEDPGESMRPEVIMYARDYDG